MNVDDVGKYLIGSSTQVFQTRKRFSCAVCAPRARHTTVYVQLPRGRVHPGQCSFVFGRAPEVVGHCSQTCCHLYRQSDCRCATRACRRAFARTSPSPSVLRGCANSTRQVPAASNIISNIYYGHLSLHVSVGADNMRADDRWSNSRLRRPRALGRRSCRCSTWWKSFTNHLVQKNACITITSPEAFAHAS